MITITKKICLIISMLPLLAHAGEQYFICGSDGDPCGEGQAKYCACIPYNETEAQNPYCLDFDNLTCTPLSQATDCNSSFIYKNQGECLSVIYNSTPVPPCELTTKQFCLDEEAAICDANGAPDSCK